MRRTVITAFLALMAGPALAAEIDPGQSPGLGFILNGLGGSANEVASPPAVAINANGLAIKLDETTLADITAKLGGEVNTAGESENAFAWVCLASPRAGDLAPTLTWFVATDTGSGALTGLAVEIAPDEIPAGCTELKAPLALTTGLPLVGATKADLDTAFGPATADSGAADTSAYVFGAVDLGDGINVRRTEAKYLTGGTFVIAASIVSFTEMK